MLMRILVGLLMCISTSFVTVYAQGSASSEASSSVSAHVFNEVAASRELISRLKRGGFVLYLRHGTTDNTRPDRFPNVDLNDCSTQRPLNDEGRKQAIKIGESLRKARIPLGEIRISPLCRVKDTAAAALPGITYVVDEKLMYTANLTTEQKNPILNNTRFLLSQPVNEHQNRLLIAHAPNLMDLMGYFPKEGTLVIFLPKGDAGFEYVASILPTQWNDLLRFNE
ncbi:histidine phosphatase family protein [Undibacterium sp. SXout7W]|uniref:histidine phosphatase family protein n=1 Tax=Undibacterium sp. SXout7W TaxID=3413049 RepID=UPI003BF40526